MTLPKKISYPLLLILAALVILFGIYLAFSRKPSRVPVAETKSSWSTYNNDFIKTSFNYPSGWYLNEDVSRVNLAISDYVGGLSTPDEAISQDHIKISFIRTSLLQNQTIDAYVKRSMAAAPSLMIEKESKILVGNLEGKEYIIDVEDGKTTRVLYIQKGRSLFTFSIAPASSKLMPTFDQILQTFEVQ